LNETSDKAKNTKEIAEKNKKSLEKTEA